MKSKQVDEFEVVNGRLESLYKEMQALARKNPNERINEFKLGLSNLVIEAANKFLSGLRVPKPLITFVHFEEDQLPSYSDALLVLSQYLASMEKIRADNIGKGIGVDRNSWYWIVEGDLSDIEAGPPKKLDG